MTIRIENEKVKSTSGDRIPESGMIKPGKVDLGHDVGIRDHAGRGAGNPFGKQRPGKQRREHEEGVGDTVRRDFCQAAEENGEDQHHEERLEDRPEKAESGLLVPDLHVAPSERV